MLTRSMARVQPAPAPSPRNGGSFQEASSFSSALNTTSSDPPFEHIQCHSSSSQEVSDSSFLTNLASQEALSFSFNRTDPPFDHIKCHSLQEVTADSFFLVNSALHSHVTQQEASGSSPSLNPNLSLNLLPVYSSHEAPNPPSIINATSSDSSFDVLGSLGELPSKPNVPSELSMNFSSVLDLEIFNTHSQRLFDKQKKLLEFTKMYIDVLRVLAEVSGLVLRRFKAAPRPTAMVLLAENLEDIGDAAAWCSICFPYHKPYILISPPLLEFDLPCADSDTSYTLISNILHSLVAFADKNIGYTPSILEEAVNLFPHSAQIINVLRCLVTRPVAEWAKHADITQAEVYDSYTATLPFEETNDF
ncbi:hypothetical protein C8R41DRAFT_918580 [Lentinula lateritia]|uniref:Uncharacterized protein n=1 Tax=Lentinula lateritia TaxID=40482 RepID=A0ABQ8VJS4_9AGAR|nr:hypothetical protein C8R41DRAFT_918580 [Lentinula lateritia]